MRRHLLPYLAFLAAFVLFAWLLSGANEGIRYLTAAVLALGVWWLVANRSRA